MITLFETIPVILFLPLSLIDFYYFIGRNVMGDLLCEVRDDLNTRPSTPPNSFSTKWESFEAKALRLQQLFCHLPRLTARKDYHNLLTHLLTNLITFYLIHQ